MHNTTARELLAGSIALSLLVGVPALLLIGVFVLGEARGAWRSANEARIMLALYYKVVVIKGLVPQALLALALYPMLRRLRTRGEAAMPGRASELLGLAIAGALSFCIVAPLLLSVEYEGWPALQMPSWGNRLGSLVLMSGAFALAAWLPRTFLPFLRPPRLGAPAPGLAAAND